MIKISICRKDIIKYSKIAKDNNLHFRDDTSLLKKWYNNVPKELLAVSVAYCGKEPIGSAAICYDFDKKPIICVYVKPKFRKYGFGSKLISKLIKNNKDYIYVAYCNSSNVRFWCKQKIKHCFNLELK